MKLLNWFTSPEAVQFYPPNLLPNQNSILKEQFNLMATIESAQIAKDIEQGRMRLSASEPLERLTDRCHVQNYSRELTQIIRKLSEIEPTQYSEMLIARLIRIVLSDFCVNEELRSEYASELKNLLLISTTSDISKYISYNLDTESALNRTVTTSLSSYSPGPRDIFNSLQVADHETVIKLFDDLESVCKRWNRAFYIPEYSKFINSALKLKLKALISLNYSEDALELCGQFQDEDLLDNLLFEPVLLILESFGNFTRAINLIESKLMQIDPEHPGIILRLVDDLMEGKRFEEAEGYLEAIKEAYEFKELDSPTQARISFATGLCSWTRQAAARDDSLAKETILSHFLAAAKANPTESKYFTWIGKFYWRLEGERERGKKCFMKALNLDPTNFQAALLYSEIVLSGAADACSIVELLKPFTKQSCHSRNRRLFYFYGVALFHSGSFLEASVAFQSALKSSIVSDDPAIEDENCLQWLGEAYMRSNRLGSASKTFARLSASSIYGKVGLASVHLKSNSPIEAVDVLDSIAVEQSLKLDGKISLDKSEALISLARHYIRQGRFISAMKSLLRALDTLITAGPCACAFRLAADCFVLAHSYRNILGFPLAEFKNKFNRSVNDLKVNPGLLEISEALVAIKSEESALCVIGAKFALAAISEASNKSTGVMAVYWLQLAVALSKFDELCEFAISAAETAVKSENCPETTAAQSHHLLALIYCKTPHSHRQAQHHFISALKRKESPLIWTDLGRFYVKAGDWELAGEAFKMALAADQEDLMAAFELAKCGGSLDGQEAARQVAQRAFSTQPVLFTEEFASTLAEYDNPYKEIARVYLYRLNPQTSAQQIHENENETEISQFITKSDLLAYLNDKSLDCPSIWLTPAAQEFDCEFLLKRPENELTQSGWRAVVEGLLPGSKERTDQEVKELQTKLLEN